VGFNRLGESIAELLHKGDYVLVDGILVGSKYENENGKSKNAKAAKVTVFSKRLRQLRGGGLAARKLNCRRQRPAPKLARSPATRRSNRRVRRPPRLRPESLFVSPAFRPGKTNPIARSRDCGGYTSSAGR
jgi:single-stranded DNA-binding protein